MSDYWSTPQWLFDRIDERFQFDVDVCAEDWSAKCEDYVTSDMDALSIDWNTFREGRVACWMNPPYSGKSLYKWTAKAYAECLRGVLTVGLLPVRTETQWFHDYCLPFEIQFLRGRVHFSDRKGRSGRPRFASMVVFWKNPFVEGEGL